MDGHDHPLKSRVADGSAECGSTINRASGTYLVATPILKAQSQVNNSSPLRFSWFFFKTIGCSLKITNQRINLWTNSIPVCGFNLLRISSTKGYRQHLLHTHIVVQLPKMKPMEVVPDRDPEITRYPDSTPFICSGWSLLSWSPVRCELWPGADVALGKSLFDVMIF